MGAAREDGQVYGADVRHIQYELWSRGLDTDVYDVGRVWSGQCAVDWGSVDGCAGRCVVIERLSTGDFVEAVSVIRVVGVYGVEEGEFWVCPLVLADFVFELGGVLGVGDECGSLVDDGWRGVRGAGAGQTEADRPFISGGGRMRPPEKRRMLAMECSARAIVESSRGRFFPRSSPPMLPSRVNLGGLLWSVSPLPPLTPP